MENRKDNIDRLIERWLENTITLEEKEELASLLNEQTLLEDVDAALLQKWDMQVREHVFSVDETSLMIAGILSNHPMGVVPHFQTEISRVHFMSRWKWIAASIVLVLAIGAYLWFNNESRSTDSPVVMQQQDALPGKNGAVLTLANGSKVSLDSIHNGIVAQQGASTAKLVNGKLLYERKNGEAVYNTLSTPKGRQFQLALPDGTKVWLNAASSITYPTAFFGKQRRVKIEGEAYFEVSQNKQQPFVVDVQGKSTVEVLGTKFNINSYGDAGFIETTLLEGSVKVAITDDNHSLVLKPHQQARQGINIDVSTQKKSNTRRLTLADEIDVEQVVAWKNGMFNFEGISLSMLMKQVERWYDVEIVYAGKIPSKTFKGKIPKNLPLSEVLTLLEFTGVKFRLENNKITVFN